MTSAKLEVLYRCVWAGERQPLWSLLVGLLWGLVAWLAVLIGVGFVTSARNVSKESALLGLVLAVLVARSRGNLEHFYVELDAECLRWNTWRSGWKGRYQEVTSVPVREISEVRWEVDQDSDTSRILVGNRGHRYDLPWYMARDDVAELARALRRVKPGVSSFGIAED